MTTLHQLFKAITVAQGQSQAEIFSVFRKGFLNKTVVNRVVTR
jgi:hypothetical protein